MAFEDSCTHYVTPLLLSNYFTYASLLLAPGSVPTKTSVQVCLWLSYPAARIVFVVFQE